MGRYIAVVEHEGGRYWISFPGIQKTYSYATQPGEIVPHARDFLDQWLQNGGTPPPSLDDALIDPNAPFEGAKLVTFEWEPPPDAAKEVT
jgi:hypothetical protein